MLNISNAVSQSQKHPFLTPRQRLISIAGMPTRRIITGADLAAADRLRGLWNLYRQKTGDTQEEAGAKIGLSQAAFSQYLNATIALNTDTALKFARLFGVHPREIRPDIDELLGGVEIETLSREVASIAKALDALPTTESKRDVLDFTLYRLKKAVEFVAKEKLPQYTALIEKFERDLTERKKRGRKRRR